MGVSQSQPVQPVQPSENCGFQPGWSVKRLNPTTHVIQEHDLFQELPLIYVKKNQLPIPHLLICDTGCGTAFRDNDLNGQLHNLRHFIETESVPSNSYQPLNPNGILPYLIICSHCHYDHVLGIPQFIRPPSSSQLIPKATIIASSYQPSYLSPENLPKSTLCVYTGLAVPVYEVGVWAGDNEWLEVEGEYIGEAGKGIKTLHIPGHTPDSLAWYDATERWIYTGDTFYERYEGGGADGEGEPMPILFPSDGDLVNYISSLEKLLKFVRKENEEATLKSNLEEEEWSVIESPPQQKEGIARDGEDVRFDITPKRVRLGCAHVTSSVDAEEIILAVRQFFWNMFIGKIPVRLGGYNEKGEVMGFWEEYEGGGERRFSVKAPWRLVLEARKHFKFA